MYRNEGVIAQKPLVAGMGERTSFAHTCRYKPRIVGDRLVARSAKLAQEPVTRQPVRSWRVVQKIAMTVPVPLIGRCHQVCPDRIQYDVVCQFQQIVFFLHQDSFVAALQYLSDKLVVPIEMLGI